MQAKYVVLFFSFRKYHMSGIYYSIQRLKSKQTGVTPSLARQELWLLAALSFYVTTRCHFSQQGKRTKLEKAKITLNDCLACRYHVTTCTTALVQIYIYWQSKYTYPYIDGHSLTKATLHMTFIDHLLTMVCLLLWYACC